MRCVNKILYKYSFAKVPKVHSIHTQVKSSSLINLSHIAKSVKLSKLLIVVFVQGTNCHEKQSIDENRVLFQFRGQIFNLPCFKKKGTKHSI